MSNRFVKDMLRSKYGRMQDGRNPYGSRGGYVTSHRVRRDREMEDYGYDMARSGRRDMNMDYNYEDDYPRTREHERDYHYPYGGYYPYEMYDYGEEDYARGRGGRYRRDYGEHEKMEFGKLSKKDYEEWGKMLENADGSRGEHFKKGQAEQIARQLGIDLHSFGGAEVFAMTMNMMYADYCAVAKKYGVDRPEFYADLAKAFLHDKDYHGKPEEKLWLYYKCIAEDDED
jgi:hypothetical protein